MKTVSVIVPIYNASNSIIDCMDSIRHQTYRDYEVILINDGSTDDSLIKVQNYIKPVSYTHLVFIVIYKMWI